MADMAGMGGIEDLDDQFSDDAGLDLGDDANEQIPEMPQSLRFAPDAESVWADMEPAQRDLFIRADEHKGQNHSEQIDRLTAALERGRETETPAAEAPKDSSGFGDISDADLEASVAQAWARMQSLAAMPDDDEAREAVASDIQKMNPSLIAGIQAELVKRKAESIVDERMSKFTAKQEMAESRSVMAQEIVKVCDGDSSVLDKTSAVYREANNILDSRVHLHKGSPSPDAIVAAFEKAQAKVGRRPAQQPGQRRNDAVSAQAARANKQVARQIQALQKKGAAGDLRAAAEASRLALRQALA